MQIFRNKNLTRNLEESLENLYRVDPGCFSDVTLVANDGWSFRGHKVVLAAQSCELFDIFKSAQSYDPVVCVLDIKSSVLQKMMDYIYLGEAQINQININEFKEAAAQLGLKGFAPPEGPDPQPPEEDIYMTMGRGKEIISESEHNRKSKHKQDLNDEAQKKKIKIGRYQNSFKDFSIYKSYFKQQDSRSIPEDLPVKKFKCVEADCGFATRFEEILRRHNFRHQIEDLQNKGLDISHRNLSLPASFCC